MCLHFTQSHTYIKKYVLRHQKITYKRFVDAKILSITWKLTAQQGRWQQAKCAPDRIPPWRFLMGSMDLRTDKYDHEVTGNLEVM